jgi:Icc-related predicted phosphoesterase
MKLVVISDTHGKHHELVVPEGDLLIHCGDVTKYGTFTDLMNFLNWFESHPHKHKIFIGGNHDAILQNLGKVEVRKLLRNSIYLQNDGCEIEGFKIWGSPTTPTFLDWYFMCPRGKEIKKYWDKIPKDTNILITHGPARRILDVAPPSPFNKKPKSVGCTDLRNKVLKLKKLMLHVFGHIHNDGGKVFASERTAFYNCSVVNEKYQVVNKPTVLYVNNTL